MVQPLNLAKSTNFYQAPHLKIMYRLRTGSFGRSAPMFHMATCLIPIAITLTPRERWGTNHRPLFVAHIDLPKMATMHGLLIHQLNLKSEPTKVQKRLL